MTRWFIKAETQLDLPLGKEDLNAYYPTSVIETKGKEDLNAYYPTSVIETNFKDKMEKLEGKNVQYIQKVIYDCLNDIPNKKNYNRPYKVIEADLIEGAFKKFAKIYADNNYTVYDVTINEVDKDNYHSIKDNTEKRYLICPFVSQTKLYDISEFNTLVKALSIKIFYYLESLNK